MESNTRCRICSGEFNHGVFVFSDEGKRLYLQAKIRKYLYITISMDDKIPKIICDNCCKKLDGIHKFATMAVKNQDMFNKLMTDSTALHAMEPKKVENKGLLHTYLTKGIIDKQNEDTETVEVRVDPMLFLEYNSDASDSDEEEDEDEEEEEEEEEENSEECEESECEKGMQENQMKSNKKYKCSTCTKSFNTEIALRNHIWYHIPKGRRLVLNNRNNYLKKESLETEEKSDFDTDQSENIGMKFGCPICGKVISTKGNLKVHLETHRPKGKYGCDICGRIFKTQCNLHRHKEYHSGIQFTCTVCGRVYPTNSTLRAHSITHSDLRPHKCPLCDKTFKRNQDLKFHINQHTGARPYQCPYCPKAFASSGNCFSHRKRMHPLEVERDRERAAKIMR